MKLLIRNINISASLTMAILLTLSHTSVAWADEPYLAEIRQFPYSFCPTGWSKTDGSFVSAGRYQKLFFLIGAVYGEDGNGNFALPNIQGRVAKHVGNGTDLGPTLLGQSGGESTFKLTKLPAHTHSAATTTTLHASSLEGNTTSPSGAYFAEDGKDRVYSQVIPDVSLNAASAKSETLLESTGNTSPAPINRRQPYLTTTYCIAMTGVYPTAIKK